MERICVSCSAKQKSRLKNGHKVRVKKGMKGKGVELMVMTPNARLMNKAFGKEKGIEIALSPEEIAHNQQMASQMAGQGIFGTKFDDFVEKTIGKKAKDVIYKGAEIIKPLAKTAITAGLTSAAAAASALQPEFAPLFLAGVPLASSLASDYLDKPSDYQGQQKKVKKHLAKKEIASAIAQSTGDNLNYQTRSAYGNALANEKASMTTGLSSRGIKERTMSSYDRYRLGQGLYAGGETRGGGLYAGGGLFAGGSCCREKASVMGKGMSPASSAMSSRPFGSHFQFQFTLPPALQKYEKAVF